MNFILTNALCQSKLMYLNDLQSLIVYCFRYQIYTNLPTFLVDKTQLRKCRLSPCRYFTNRERQHYSEYTIGMRENEANTIRL